MVELLPCLAFSNRPGKLSRGAPRAKQRCNLRTCNLFDVPTHYDPPPERLSSPCHCAYCSWPGHERHSGFFVLGEGVSVFSEAFSTSAALSDSGQARADAGKISLHLLQDCWSCALTVLLLFSPRFTYSSTAADRIYETGGLVASRINQSMRQ